MFDLLEKLYSPFESSRQLALFIIISGVVTMTATLVFLYLGMYFGALTMCFLGNVQTFSGYIELERRAYKK